MVKILVLRMEQYKQDLERKLTPVLKEDCSRYTRLTSPFLMDFAVF